MLTCKGCIDLDTCQLVERVGNERCRSYTRIPFDDSGKNYHEMTMQRKEIPYDPSKLDGAAWQMYQRRRGKMKKKVDYDL